MNFCFFFFRKRKGLPYQFTYFAFLLAFVAQVVASFLVIAYGLSYGMDVTVNWIKSFFGAFFQTAGFVQPIRVNIDMKLCEMF